ncbi:hypothetical protein COCCADRAFT_30131 [Bipolaris zeicola 26-R-13]|uniref:Uncharacterized protein n=1 Tax=Cochliobolus carbonum (strain 26-R-13) TaxID=930089 RepID=W6YBW1_COCC2|nr:uncharacterized protein COCCADRAFT_30131 [Bipolaris zeicola 26-R-13]EUC28656.1 hypothetical protein COCCADRAFT_30131 [Bipolaris zeicola 26-R-13]
MSQVQLSQFFPAGSYRTMKYFTIIVTALATLASARVIVKPPRCVTLCPASTFCTVGTVPSSTNISIILGVGRMQKNVEAKTLQREYQNEHKRKGGIDTDKGLQIS